jgi:hypothetical protein
MKYFRGYFRHIKVHQLIGRKVSRKANLQEIKGLKEFKVIYNFNLLLTVKFNLRNVKIC